MATLEKIRNKAGLLIIVVGLALFAFIIGDFLNSGSTYFRQTQEKVAEINGEVISIRDFEERVAEMAEVYRMQMNTNTLPEEYMIQIRQSVFDIMVQDVVLGEVADDLGFMVSQDELFDMVQGENIVPAVLNMREAINPQTGMFDRMQLLQFLQMVQSDDLSMYPAEYQPYVLQMKNYWLVMEKNIKRQRLEQKYTNLLSKAVSANNLDAKEAFNENTVSSDIRYVKQAFTTVADSLVSVSDSEIKKLYDQKKELYKQPESKVVKYIAVDIVPSEEDYNKVRTDIESIKDEFVARQSVEDLVTQYSEVPFTNAYFSQNSMDPEMRQFVASAEIGEVYGPVFEDNTYRMFKLLDKKSGPDSVRVSHILLPNNNDEFQSLADSLFTELKKGANFASVAMEYSFDENSAQVGGDLSWMNEAGALRGIGEEFKDVVFSTPVNGVAMVNTLYGIHLIKITDRTSNVPKYKVADIEMTVAPSSRTYSNIYNSLNQFISKNTKLEDAAEAAREAGYIISDATVTVNDQMLGSVRSSRPVIRWAFENGKGKLSDIFECDDKFVVANVMGTIKEGYRSLKSVEPSLKAELLNQKKGEKIVAELNSKSLSSLEAYSDAMVANIDTVKFISFGTRRITTIGTEPKLNALVSLASVNQVSEPVNGNTGVYVFQVYERNTDSKEYDEAQEITTLNASNMYRVGFQAIQSLINDATIKDSRIRFY